MGRRSNRTTGFAVRARAKERPRARDRQDRTRQVALRYAYRIRRRRSAPYRIRDRSGIAELILPDNFARHDRCYRAPAEFAAVKRRIPAF